MRQCNLVDQSVLIDQNLEKAQWLILNALAEAQEKFPSWPNDPFHAAAILNEEVGELNKALLDFTYKGATIDDAITEAAQTGAMAIRMLQYLLEETEYSYE